MKRLLLEMAWFVLEVVVITLLTLAATVIFVSCLTLKGGILWQM